MRSKHIGTWLFVIVAAVVAVVHCPTPALAQGTNLGACCHANGTCTATTFENCPPSSTTFFQGACVTCDQNICVGRCCGLDGTCTVLSIEACFAIQGNPQGLGEVCEPSHACAFAVGPCCLSDGRCQMMTRADCSGIGGVGGVFQGTGLSCRGECLPPRGACCRGGQCAYTFEADCGEHTWMGASTTCQLFFSPCCPAEFNKSGVLSVQDIFDFLAAYFAASMSADFNDNCVLSVQDIFDFLAAYFAGCP